MNTKNTKLILKISRIVSFLGICGVLAWLQTIDYEARSLASIGRIILFWICFVAHLEVEKKLVKIK